MARLTGKCALITGGARGLGLAHGKRLAEYGAKVMLTDLDAAAVTAAAAELKKAGLDVHALRQDVTDEAGWDATLQATVAALGGLNVLVNNAGIAFFGDVETCSYDNWRKTQAVNLDAVFLGTRAAVRHMKDHGGGSIINISSIEGIIGDPNLAAYNASKGGVRLLTKSAALHCARQHYGIRVNSVHPGYVLTDMVKGALATLPADAAAAAAEDLKTNKTPMGRFGTAHEIAELVAFLASDESSYSTGSEFVADGGYSAQ
ncbi:MAG: glucose 1-dehydrogenase [Nevskiaceae bacterium]|nr:MAG: glucose 1-dehydrogenase [Nevskiaceae bacterium]TBR74420.1 MAG: glucose 1-dehydrogenase [Nevskiaceae bacterium]